MVRRLDDMVDVVGMVTGCRSCAERRKVLVEAARKEGAVGVAKAMLPLCFGGADFGGERSSPPTPLSRPVPPPDIAASKRDRDRRHDGYRGSARARGYTARWDRARAAYLLEPENALCRSCRRRGLVVPATVVDHVTAHKGDQTLFWDRANWQPLCAPCHNGDKQREERGRTVQQIALDGWPVESQDRSGPD